MPTPGTVVVDNEAQALYIHTKQGKVAKTLELTPDILIDLDEEGKIIGIEALNLSGNVKVSKNLLADFI